ncbi:MAG: RNA polymerase sigma factor [Candidatus Margulisiibacteriota bacterium]
MIKLDFQDIYNEHKDKVWSLTSRYVSSQADKEDLFQEVFLKIHQALPKFRGESALSTWIYRITVNTALNFLEKRSRQKKLLDLLSRFSLHEAEEPVEFNDAVWKPLEKLNPQQRMILLLSDVEERKLEEIGTLLKLPLGTVKSTLHRAREIIKKEVMKNGDL